MKWQPIETAPTDGTRILLCRRRESGREQWQTYIAPAIDMMSGQCSNFIEPPKVYATNNTVPNETAKGPR